MDSRQKRTLIAAIAAVTVFDVALGMSFPLLTLVLEARGTEAWLIGLNAGATPLGVVASGPLIPFLSSRFGSRRTARIAAFAVAVLFLSFHIFDDVWLWFPLRFLLGASAGTLFALSESWVVQSAEGPYRGRITALYASILAAGFGAGPVVLLFTGHDGWMPFVVGAVVLIIAQIPLSFVEPEDRPAGESGHVSFFTFLPLAPILLTAVGVFSLMDAAVLSLLPLYGLQHGLEASVAALMLSALILGNVALQYPLGWLADRIPRRSVMSGCAFATAVAAAALPLSMGHWTMWPLLVVIGTAGFGIYTMAIAMLGDRFKGTALVAGVSAFTAMWGIGGMVGPPVAGLAMQAWGPDGLPFTIAALFAAFALASWLRGRFAR